MREKNNECVSVQKASERVNWMKMYAHRPYQSGLMFENCGIRVGDRVLVGGLYSGSVKYIGNLDVPHPNSELYVGARLDDPVGDSDGIWYGKRFFNCARGHGIFVPIHKVHLLVSRQKKLQSKAKYLSHSTRMQSASTMSKQKNSKFLKNSVPPNGLKLADNEQMDSKEMNDKKLEQSFKDTQRPSTSKQRNREENDKEKSEMSDSWDDENSYSAAGLPAVVQPSKLSDQYRETKLQSEESAICLPQLRVSAQSNATAVNNNKCKNKSENKNCSFRMSHRFLTQKSSRKFGGIDLYNDSIQEASEVHGHCRSSCCSGTAERAIAQMLRDDIYSTYKDPAGNEVLQVDCISDDYLTAKLRVLLRKLYSKPSIFQQCRESPLNSSKKLRTPLCSSNENNPNFTSENFSYRCATAPPQTIPQQRRSLGRITSSTGRIIEVPSLSRERSISTCTTCSSGMDSIKLGSRDLSRLRWMFRDDEDMELQTKKRSLQMLKDEIHKLTKVTEYAEKELEQSLANVDSLASISIEELRRQFMDLKQKASATIGLKRLTSPTTQV